jgi:glycerol transport system ATP-binding protein
MADIRLEDVAHSYDGGATWALQPMTMTWRHGQAYALLGPSGSGKTTLLNIISGLLTPTAGRIWFGDREVTTVPTAGRNVAQVFQFPVLYEGMSVYDNLAFPLRNRKHSRADTDLRVRRVAELLGLTDQLPRRSRRLDAGRQQIVCLGRGLVRSDVAAVLLDEPLTVIDPGLKWTMRSKLKEIHRDTGHTLIYVTHDQTEALTFADEVVVLNDGAVLQTGEPTDLFLAPEHEFVGHFIGSPGMNVLPADLRDGVVRIGAATVGRALGTAGGLPDGPVRIGVRPEFVRVTPQPVSPGVTAAVTEVDRMGAYDLVHAEVDSTVDGTVDGRVDGQPAGRRTALTAKVAAGTRPAPGTVAHLGFAADRAYLFRESVRCGRITALDGLDREEAS